MEFYAKTPGINSLALHSPLGSLLGVEEDQNLAFELRAKLSVSAYSSERVGAKVTHLPDVPGPGATEEFSKRASF